MRQIVLPAPTNPVPYPQAVNSPDALKPYIAGAAAVDAYRANTVRYQDYLSGTFAIWNANYQAGRATEPPPPVPMGVHALMSEDGLGWDLEESDKPVGFTPVYAKTGTTSGAAWGTMGGTKAMLIAAVGKTATQSDGTVWLRLS